jgi:hypothetical protein
MGVAITAMPHQLGFVLDRDGIVRLTIRVMRKLLNARLKGVRSGGGST